MSTSLHSNDDHTSASKSNWKKSKIIHFHLPSFFKSSDSSSASSVAVADKPVSAAATALLPTPDPTPISKPASIAPVADLSIVQQIQALPAGQSAKHEDHSEAHKLFRTQAGHAPRGTFPETVNPVSFPTLSSSFVD